MGVVYAGEDEALSRTVAVKTLAALAPDDTARKRFLREARAAAMVNHPHICQLYEIGETEGGAPFIAMELLEGESVAERLRRGPLPVGEAIAICLPLLDALQALHDRGLIHRDLKPSNVFLTGHGVKLLDFGLARPSDEARLAGLPADSVLTQSGTLVGTPRYMAPEQISGEKLDARADIFAAGSILFETLAGRPAFAGRTVVEVLHATLHEQPPALTGSPTIAAVDRVVRRALAKTPADRYPTAETMAADLRPLGSGGAQDPAVHARTLTRLVVLPFRVLKPDPETDFLAFSLADSIATSLSGLASLVVRSSALAARLAGERPDLKAIATEAEVDFVVLGTLLRAEDQLRVTIQLVEAPSGTLSASQSVQAPLGDLFKLEGDLTQRLVQSLAVPLSGREPTRRSAPESARAYELYLRANEVARGFDQLPLARDLYRACLEEDPAFAPAWARLGRVYRLIAKYILEDVPGNRTRAEEAFRRALDLDPDLTLAHKFLAHHEAEVGRAPAAMERLLKQAERHGQDPELFAGLVHACRYCGLFDASLAAHAEAKRLDPHAPTSASYTLLIGGQLERLLQEPEPTVTDVHPRLLALVALGRMEEAATVLAAADLTLFPRVFQVSIASIERIIRGAHDEAVQALERAGALFYDPEALYTLAMGLAKVGERERAVALLSRAVDGGFFVASALEDDPVFAELRPLAPFAAALERSRQGHEAACQTFRRTGGERLLGVRLASPTA
jgi:serine/threonine-protein kinase